MNKENVFYPVVNEGLNIAKTLLTFGLIALIILLIVVLIIKIFK